MILVLGAGGYYLVKSYLPGLSTPEGVGSDTIAARIAQVDSALWDIVEELDLPRSSLSLDTKTKKSNGELEWTYKEIRVDLPPGAAFGSVEKAVFGALAFEGVSVRLSETRESLISFVDTYGQPSHKLRFMRRPADSAPSTVPEPIVKKEGEGGLARPRVAIIIDDLGADPAAVDRLLAIDADLSFAVLPRLAYSRYAAEMAAGQGRDVMLHLPMEPRGSSGYNGANAGPGALLVSTPRGEILTTLSGNIESVPYIVGVNNHMGSLFTENGDLMELVLSDLKGRGLFFVDSRTTSATKGFATARRLGMKTAQRDIFLDELDLGPEYMMGQLEKLVEVSRQKGVAVGICHPYSHTIDVLAEMVPMLKGEVDFIPISQVVN